MRKFDQPFDAYELLNETPMSIELYPKKLAQYEHLFRHPIYYYNCFQYMRGSFYRAALGYEVIWDKKYEDSLVRQLDHTLHYYIERKEYYFEDVKFILDCSFYGTEWWKGVARKYDMLNQKKKEVLLGQTALARVNLLDKPNHVDLDFDDGSVWTIPYMRYLHLKKHHLKVFNESKSAKSKQNSTNAKNAEPNQARSPKGTGEKIASRDFPPNVFDLQERRRRLKPMRKAPKQVRSRLVSE